MSRALASASSQGGGKKVEKGGKKVEKGGKSKNGVAKSQNEWNIGRCETDPPQFLKPLKLLFWLFNWFIHFHVHISNVCNSNLKHEVINPPKKVKGSFFPSSILTSSVSPIDLNLGPRTDEGDNIKLTGDGQLITNKWKRTTTKKHPQTTTEWIGRWFYITNVFWCYIITKRQIITTKAEKGNQGTVVFLRLCIFRFVFVYLYLNLSETERKFTPALSVRVCKGKNIFDAALRTSKDFHLQRLPPTWNS